jgi:hypothetical protein
MTRSSKLLWTAALGAFLIAAVTSCNESNEQEAAEHSTTATTTDNGATAMQGTSAVQVVAVDLGRNIGTDKQVTERLDTFKPNDTVYASIHTSGSAPNSKLGVKWYQNGQVVSQAEQPIVEPEGTNALEFHLSQPAGLPAGDYKVEVTVDGATVQTKEFRVVSS